MDKLNIMIIGSAGSGKSYTILNEMVPRWISEGKKYALLCPTGVAAVHLGGTTLHRFFGIGLGRGDKDQLLKLARTKAGKKIREIEIIVIDEISMVPADLLDSLNYICQQIRHSVLPFGGIQVVFSGDFLQLAPVSGEFAFKAEVWKDFDFNVITLTEPKRFDDLSFWKMLMRARIGKLKRKDIARLIERCEAFKRGDHLKSKITPTVVYSYRADVDRINQEKLSELPGKEWWYRASDKVPNETFKSLLDNSAPTNLCLKVGAQVMCTSNIDIEAGICNGSRGIVEDCTDTLVSVLFTNGERVDLTTVDWELEENNVKIKRSQIPVRLAWASTIHKCQGLTIDSVILNLNQSIFCPGQSYVAMSRCRRYSSLYLESFTPNAIFCSQEAKEFYGL